MNIYNLLKENPAAVIGYLGGSITSGVAASNPEKCYRSLVTSELRKNFPDIVEINAGFGGTGSDLGIYRIDKDLLLHRPDIVFIEFAVNDFENKNTAYYMEGIIQKIFNLNCSTLICILFTFNEKMHIDYLNNKIPNAVLKQQMLAEHYNIPCINVGKALSKTIAEKSADFKEYFYDDTHPNDNGHRFYANIICESLKTIDFNINYFAPILDCQLPVKTEMVAACDYITEKWRMSAGSMLHKFPNYIYSCEKGAQITFEFTGTEIGIFYTMEKDSGFFEYSVDHDDFIQISAWDEYSPDFARCAYKILKHNMKNTSHTLKIRVSGKHMDLSEGSYIRIGAFLVSKPQYN